MLFAGGVVGRDGGGGGEGDLRPPLQPLGAGVERLVVVGGELPWLKLPRPTLDGRAGARPDVAAGGEGVVVVAAAAGSRPHLATDTLPWQPPAAAATVAG